MNKKYLSVVLFGALMLGTAGTFTGCIDNDEPVWRLNAGHSRNVHRMYRQR